MLLFTLFLASVSLVRSNPRIIQEIADINMNEIDDESDLLDAYAIVYREDDTSLSNFNIPNVQSNGWFDLNRRLKKMQEHIFSLERKSDDILNRLNILDCYDIKVKDPTANSGIYDFYLDYQGKRLVKVYCDMLTAGGGWTVIQQRLPRDSEKAVEIESMIHPTEFNRDYHEYRVGFGEPDRDYWVGLDNIFAWTNTRQYELRIELTDFDKKKAYAQYSFYIEDSSQGFRIHVGNYQGTAGDGLSISEGYDNFTSDGMMFSTSDRDQDTSNEINCSKFWNIGGWWFNRCSWANLNGPYKLKEERQNCTGINWHKWRNLECLRSSTMMIRPRKT